MSVLNKIKDRLAKLEKQKDEALEAVRKEFPDLFAELFEKSVLINSVSWTQYTPYFMDGDECVFGINADELDVNGINQYEDEDADEPVLNWIDKIQYINLTSEKELEDFLKFANTEEGKAYKSSAERAVVGSYGYKLNPHYNKKEVEILSEFSNIIHSIPEEFLRSLFGDHVRVTIHRDGKVETDTYEHD